METGTGTETKEQVRDRVNDTPYTAAKPFTMGGREYKRGDPFHPSAHDLESHKVSQLLRQRFIQPNQAT